MTARQARRGQTGGEPHTHFTSRMVSTDPAAVAGVGRALRDTKTFMTRAQEWASAVHPAARPVIVTSAFGRLGVTGIACEEDPGDRWSLHSRATRAGARVWQPSARTQAHRDMSAIVRDVPRVSGLPTFFYSASSAAAWLTPTLFVVGNEAYMSVDGVPAQPRPSAIHRPALARWVECDPLRWQQAIAPDVVPVGAALTPRAAAGALSAAA